MNSEVKITVLDEESYFAHDTVGQLVLRLELLCLKEGFDAWLPLRWKGKPSGEIHLKGKWLPRESEIMKPLGAKLRQMIEKQRVQIQAENAEKAAKEAEDTAAAVADKEVEEEEEEAEAALMTPRTLGDVQEPLPPKPNLVYTRHYPMPHHLNLNDSTKKKINTLLL